MLFIFISLLVKFKLIRSFLFDSLDFILYFFFVNDDSFHNLLHFCFYSCVDISGFFFGKISVGDSLVWNFIDYFLIAFSSRFRRYSEATVS